MLRRALWVRLLPAVAVCAVATATTVLAQGFGGTVSDILVRGDSLLAQKKTTEAIIQYQDARTLCPTPAEMVHSLQGEALARIAQGELLPAVGLLEEAWTRHPDDPRGADLMYTAGQALHKAGEYDRAIDVLRQALNRNPTPDILPGIRYLLSQALRLRGRPGEVVETLRDFETTYPQHPLLPNVLYLIAIASHDNKDLRTAEETYRTLIERFPGRSAAVEAHFELAMVLAEEGKKKEAVDTYRQYVALAPSSPFAAKALERAGDASLLRSPRESAELYALAQLKAGVNPQPAIPGMTLGRFIGTKRAIASTLSRAWVVALLVIALTGAAASLVIRIGRWWRRRREAITTA